MGAYTSNAMVQYVHESKSPGSLMVRQLPKMHKARKRHRMFAHNDKIFVMGGQASSVEVFDVITEQWRLYEGMLWQNSGSSMKVCYSRTVVAL